MVKIYPKLYEDTLVGKVRKFVGFPRQNPNDIADSLRPKYRGDYSWGNRQEISCSEDRTSK